MEPSQQKSPDERRIDDEAAEWVVKRDRGLSSQEAARYRNWLEEDPSRRERVARHESVWSRFDALSEEELDPNLFEETSPTGRGERRRRLRLLAGPVAALAASLAIVATLWLAPESRESAAPQSSFSAAIQAEAYQSRVLADGTIVELNGGASLRARFDEAVRAVWLERGEAHFHVAKETGRPFVVHAGAAKVRAVGTAFNVRLAEEAVDVIVTEGRVRLDISSPSASASRKGDPILEEPLELGAYQRSILSGAARMAKFTVDTITPEQTRELLAWKPEVLEFSSVPLGDVVVAFNKRNSVQLVVSEKELAKLPLDITFRSDDVEAFARLLELTFAIRAVRRDPNTIELSRAD